MSTYEDASLIFYPSGYKAGKAYSLKPTDGSGDLTFTRASTATRVNSAGLIESVATGVPRIDFTGGGCAKLLLEPQRTNLVFPSATASTQTRTTTAQSYTLSFYGTGTVVRSGTSTGTLVGTGANDRVFVTFTATAGSLTLTVTGSVTNWQLEAGAYSTSVIITTTTAVTRVAESATKSGISSLIGQTEGTIFFEWSKDVLNFGSNYSYFQLGDYPNYIGIYIQASNCVCEVINSGVVQASISKSSVSIGTHKAAVAYANNDIAFYFDGVQVGIDSLATIPSTTAIRLNANSGIAEKISQAVLFKTRLTNAELATLTTL